MKTIHKILTAIALTMGLSSCSTDIDQLKLLGFDGADARELNISSSDVVLDGYNEEAKAVTFEWGSYDLYVSDDQYGVPEKSITSYIELSKNEDFSPVDTALVVEGYKKDFTNQELNLILSKKGYPKKEKAPLYARIRYVLGENDKYQYSKVANMSVTPYGIILNKMNMLATNKETVVGTIYSPTENGIYSGYVAASSDWMNFYLQEKDNTIWGCVPDQAYNMSNDEGNMWNFWFPTLKGSYRLTADTNSKTWMAEKLTSMKLIAATGKSYEMKFTAKTNTWTAVVKVTAEQTFSAKASTTKYDIENKDGVEGETIEYNQLLNINQPGTWLVSIDMNGEQPAASYEETSEEEAYEPSLLMIDNNNWNNVKCRLYSANKDGKYIGFYHTTTGWENFLLATEGKETIYGSLPGSQFTLDSSNNHYNLWGDEKVGLYLYSVSLQDESWSQRYINTLTVAGSFNNWSDSAMPMTYDPDKKEWYADLDINTVGDGLKILLDKSWDEVFMSTGNGTLDYRNGSNIMPPSTGKYRLTINLTDMEHLTYQFTAK